MSKPNDTARRLTLANMLTGFRVVASPVLLYLAWIDAPSLFLCLLTAVFLSDAADGVVARRTSGPTEFGARLDSLADAIAYAAIGISVLLLWPDVVRRELPAFVVVGASLVLPAAFGLAKFGQLTSYHTRLVKLAVSAVAIGLMLLLLGVSPWPFRAAAVLAVLSGIEEIAITLLLSEPKSDIGGIRSAWRTWLSS